MAPTIHTHTRHLINPCQPPARSDQRVYRQPLAPGAAPAPLTRGAGGGALRFADFCLDAPRARLVAVCEDHAAVGGGGGGQEAENYIAAIGARGLFFETAE